MTVSVRSRPILSVSCLLMAWSIVAAGTARACSVPVFRYALEHWQPDPYRVQIVHRSPLTPGDMQLVRQVQDRGAPHANVTAEVTDLTKSPAPELLELWRVAGSPEKPWLILQAPRFMRHTAPVWSGPLTAGNVALLLDSPVRKAVAERIGHGESAVWLLLESGDKAADDAAAQLLEARLAYLGSVMELPKLDEQDIKNGLVSLPEDGLHLSFSVLRVSREDPAEQALVQMLLATEGDLKDQHAPIAFPVFGQGRALYALVGKGIKHETIDEAAGFLIGSCSCQVKEQNPGADLLMAVNWKDLLKAQSGTAQDLPKVSDIVGTMPEAVTISARSAAEGIPVTARSGSATGTPMKHVPAVIIVALALVIAGWIVMRKKNPSTP